MRTRGGAPNNLLKCFIDNIQFKQDLLKSSNSNSADVINSNLNQTNYLCKKGFQLLSIEKVKFKLQWLKELRSSPKS